MPFDWSLVVGSLVGAAIGLAGDWSGRLGARRQAARARQELQQDAEAARQIQREEAYRRGIEERETRALENILAAMVELPGIASAQTATVEVIDSVSVFLRRAVHESLYVARVDLRNRVQTAYEALDFAKSNRLETFSLAECVYTVRDILRSSIGSHLRGENQLPPASRDWEHLSNETEAAHERWRQSMQRDGYDATSIMHYSEFVDEAPGDEENP